MLNSSAHIRLSMLDCPKSVRWLDSGRAPVYIRVMDLRQITPTYFVAPQLDPADMPAVAEAGITRVICNRPDGEIPPSHHAAVLKDAAEAAGVEFHILPLTHQTFTPENIARQAELIAADGNKVLAYCASGTRSTIAWALGQAGQMDIDAILSAARDGGYDLSNIRPALEAAAQGQN